MWQFAAALNQENKRDDACLLGYSMGGRLALHALLEPSSRWKKAVIVSAHTGLSSEQEKKIRRQFDTEWAFKALSKTWADFLRQWQDQGVLTGELKLPMGERKALDVWKKEIARSFIDWSTGAQEDLLPFLKNIQIPVLWITGERDEKFTKIAELAVNELPYGEHILLKNAGHRVPWEANEEFSQVLNSFLM